MINFGDLIKKMRIDNEISLVKLSSNICATSYLSKIENNLVEANDEIINGLIKKLGVDIEYLEEIDSNLTNLVNDYYNGLKLGLDRTEICEEIYKQKEIFMKSRYIIFYYIYELYKNDKIFSIKYDKTKKKEIDKLKNLLDCADNTERIYINIYFSLISDKNRDKIFYLDECEKIGEISLVKFMMADIHFHLGKYLQAIKISEKGYIIASLEGNVTLMYYLCIMIGNCYSNMNEGNEIMNEYYDRAISLSEFLSGNSYHEVYYNIGSTYLENHNLENAFVYLSKIENYSFGNYERDFFLYHKLSCLFLELNDLNKVEIYIEKMKLYAKQFELNKKNITEKIISIIEIRRSNCDYIHDEVYAKSLEYIFINAEKIFHYGLKRFYFNDMEELYISQRRYKELLNQVYKKS